MAVKPVVYDETAKTHRPLGTGEKMDGLGASSILSSDAGNLLESGSDGLAYVSGSGISGSGASNLIGVDQQGRLQLTAERLAEWLDGHPQDASALAAAILAGGDIAGAISSLDASGLQEIAAVLADGTSLTASGGRISAADVSSALSGAGAGTAPRALSDRFGDAVSVKDYGAKGDGETDDLAAFQAAFAAGRPVYVPEGVYLVSGPVLVPSHGRLFGCGDRSVIKAAAGMDSELDVVCNEKRVYNTDYGQGDWAKTRSEYDVDVDIRIWDLCIDGNVWDGRRYAAEPVPNSGCGLMLSGVRDAVVYNVTVRNSMGHAINVTDTYVRTHSGTTIADRSRVFNGYSQNVSIVGCTVVDPYLDDAITTHVTKGCLIASCRCTFDYDGKASVNNHAPQAGIEIDDGCENVSVVGCYVEGFGCGFNAKAHSLAPATSNVSFTNIVVKRTLLGFVLSHGFSRAVAEEYFENPDEFDYNIDVEDASGFFLKNITIDGIDLMPYSYGAGTFARGMLVSQVRNVYVDGLSICNINPNIGFENFLWNASKVCLKNIAITGYNNVLDRGSTTDLYGHTIPEVHRPRSGLFNTGSSRNFAGPDIQFHNINVDEVGYACNVVWDLNNLVTEVKGVHLIADTQPIPDFIEIEETVDGETVTRTETEDERRARLAVVNLSYGRDAVVENVSTADSTRRAPIRTRYHNLNTHIVDGQEVRGYKIHVTDYDQILRKRVNVAQSYFPKNNEDVGTLCFDEFTENHPNIRFATTFCINGSTAPASSAPDLYDEDSASTDYQTCFYLKANSLSGASAANGGSSLGRSDRPWTEVFASTGSINTSDLRMKRQVAPFPDEVLDAWEDVELRQFLFSDAVLKKGAAARLHSGIVAQQVQEAFGRHGLDASRYGLFCFDQWDDEYEDDGDGGRTLVLPAGDKYGIRYVEALVLEAACQRRRADRLEARLAAVEARLSSL